ncbi:uncharacterized protein LOC121381467 [Gigantopelta aegis]|uniref:uncharacterized protein LOC121381467 n=1 Tax=Gigantopelta aegis TaxID=1735272 RepID=UPI001B889316|nr:uncharacterized protein LOC121381467 [Gigantopelta aegis]
MIKLTQAVVEIVRDKKEQMIIFAKAIDDLTDSSFVGASAACTFKMDTVDSFEDVHAYSPPKSRDASNQTTIKPFFRSVSSQSSYLTKVAECQTLTSVCDVGIQCDLLLPVSADSSDSSCPPMDDENIDPTYKPLENSGSDESDISIDKDEQPVIPPHEERKFLVFESMLLSLFAICTVCSNVTVASVKYVMGTFIQIQQLCHTCGHQRLWNSQPFIGNIPAGNLLLSSAILCAGALPTLTLRVMKHLRCLTICSDTFFRHQSVYLHPCISTVWLRHQKDLLRDAATQNKLMLAGDGRADSPGGIQCQIWIIQLD